MLRLSPEFSHRCAPRRVPEKLFLLRVPCQSAPGWYLKLSKLSVIYAGSEVGRVRLRLVPVLERAERIVAGTRSVLTAACDLVPVQGTSWEPKYYKIPPSLSQSLSWRSLRPSRIIFPRGFPGEVSGIIYTGTRSIAVLSSWQQSLQATMRLPSKYWSKRWYVNRLCCQEAFDKYVAGNAGDAAASSQFAVAELRWGAVASFVDSVKDFATFENRLKSSPPLEDSWW